MHYLTPDTFPRQQQFDHYRNVALPYVGICADVEVQTLLAHCKAHGVSAYRAILYACTLVAQELPWMRWRIREDGIVEHERLDCAVTALGEDQQVRFTSIPWQSSWSQFNEAAQQVLANASASPNLYNGEPEGTDNLIYHSCVPWLRFTQMVQPMPMAPACSVPRIMWGKYDVQGERTLMPLVIQAHHGLADGLHLAQFFERLQDKFSAPEQWLSD
ncbi:CatA-like O-acetyltransferase [Ferrimonas balearica]|uniref:CatA-like O-acetyltransferase n=1 Tax=Ferrimonas balearica TaxID=44012 RepID=UPI001C994604|nr:CatA-like O-acetyltransferase [Ferrimonas balearica]MBY5923416.1 hypothetical protein [Ferrimonas balearica]MBY5995166.1 hypothetical protein [Ferrimonas balearica]